MMRMEQMREEGHGRGCISGQLLPIPIASMQNQRILWNHSTRASYPEVRKRRGGNDNQAAVRPMTRRWGLYEGLGTKRKG